MKEEALLKSLEESITAIDEEQVMGFVKQALTAGIDPYLITGALEGGMRVIGDRFASGRCFIPELILAGKVFDKVMGRIEPLVREGGKEVKKEEVRIVVGTVNGDLHDLGLKLVSMAMSVNGFDVVNLGKDVPVETFIAGVKELKPHILGLSALLTTTLSQQEAVIEALKQHDLRDKVKVMIGGAPVTQDWADSIGADAVGFDAIDAVEKARKLIEGAADEIGTQAL